MAIACLFIDQYRMKPIGPSNAFSRHNYGQHTIYFYFLLFDGRACYDFIVPRRQLCFGVLYVHGYTIIHYSMTKQVALSSSPLGFDQPSSPSRIYM